MKKFVWLRPRLGHLGKMSILAMPLLTGGCVIVLGVPPSLLMPNPELEETTVQGEGKAKILMIDISGEITEQSSQGAIGLFAQEGTLQRVEAELEKAERDDKIRAILLRVNSPGGGVTASDEIYARIKEFKRKHHVPVVAAMGDLAASGGYYVSMSADKVVASPTTVTGSIGVILMSFSAEGLLQKIGVKNETIVSGPNKDLLSPLRTATPEQRLIVQNVVNDLYGRFVATVRENRPNLKQDQLTQITDGRVFSAQEALNLGMVDQIGRLPDAIALAQKMAGVQQAQVIRYQRGGEYFDNLYAHLGMAKPQAGLLPLLGLPQGEPRFLYMWSPNAMQG